MKKYLIFILSFAALYMIFQLSTGAILTALYKPEFSPAVSHLSQEIVFGGASFIPLLVIFLSATIAYFISQKTNRNSTVPVNS